MGHPLFKKEVAECLPLFFVFVLFFGGGHRSQEQEGSIASSIK